MAKSAASILLLALAVGLYFREAVTLQGAFFVQDVMVQNYPFRHFVAEALRQFDLPLWHPGINCGFPLFAEGQAGVLYPFNLLTALLLPVWVGISFNVVFHLWLGGVGTFAYLRLIDAGRAGALTGGMTFALSGYAVVRAMSQNFVDVMAWMPFLFAALELAARRRSLRCLGLAAGVFALQLLAGHPQAALYSAAAAFLYALYRGLGMRGNGAGSGSGLSSPTAVWTAAVAGTFALGAGMAAVQLLPTWELVQLSGRSEGLTYEQFARMSLPPERLVCLLLPDFFGNSATGSYWGREAGFFIQLCPYIGVLPLLLAVLALRGNRNRHAPFFAALAAAALLLSLGRYTVLYEVLYELPGLSFFRIPTRFLLWWAFAAAVLSGLGLERLCSGGHRKWWFGSLFAAALVAALAAGVNWDLVRENPAGPGEKPLAVERYREDLSSDLARCGLVLAAAVPLGFLAGPGRRRRLAGWVVPLVLFVDLADFGRDFNGVIEPGVYLEPPRTAKRIAESAAADSAAGELPHAGGFRVASFVSERGSGLDWHNGWVHDLGSYRSYPETLRMYTGSLYGLANTLPGWSPLHLSRHWEFARGYPRFLSLANVRFVVAHAPMRQVGLRLLQEGDLFLYENSRPLPRAFLVGEARVIPGAGERLRYLLGNRFRPEREVVLGSPPEPGSTEGGVSQPAQPAPGRFPAGEARVTRYEPHRVEVAVAPVRRGFLLLGDSHFPGWRVAVDGEVRPMLLANHVFRAVSVGPGDREVVFRFEPASFRIGAWISIASLLLWAGVTFAGGRAPWAKGKPPELERFLSWTWQLLLVLLLHAVIRQWPLWAGMLERCRAPAGWF